jgi:hypothetical protein
MYPLNKHLCEESFYCCSNGRNIDNKIDAEIIRADIRSSAQFIKASNGCKKSDLASVGDSTAQLRLLAVSFPVSYFVR